MHFVFTILRKDKITLLGVIRKLDNIIKRRYACTVAFLLTDAERGFGLKDDSDNSVRSFCEEQGITLELRAPYTVEQNGAAERAGRSLIEKARAMLVAANLP